MEFLKKIYAIVEGQGDDAYIAHYDSLEDALNEKDDYEATEVAIYEQKEVAHFERRPNIRRVKVTE